MILDEPLFEPSAMDNLKFYKYSAVDKSPLTKYILRHWWDFAASFFPQWMAPNVITLAGLGFILFNTFTAALYCPDLLGPAPSWVYYSLAIGLFLYQTFDNVDGRQARRTGSSSALGHIFDHTIDSLNVPLSGLLQVVALGLGHTRRGAFMILIGLWPMWLSTWEEYYTETLYLGYINGPTEGILIACCVHMISGFFGPTIWKIPCQSLLPLDWLPSKLLLIDVFQVFVVFAVFVLHAPECMRNVFEACKKRHILFLDALKQSIPFIIYNILALSWIFSPHTSLLRSPYREEVRSGSGGLFEFGLLVTFTFGKLGPRIILARLTKSPFPWFNAGAFLPLVGGTIIANSPSFVTYFLFSSKAASKLPHRASLEQWYLHLALIYASLNFVFWFVTLCRSFSVTLDIWCLSLKDKKMR